MIYNANNQNDPGRWGPSQSESVDIKTALKTHKKPLLIIGAVVLVVLSALFWIGLFGAMSDSDSYSSNGISSQSAQSPEEGYLNLLEMERPHNFASDADAIQFGYAVCDMLDTEYLSVIGDQLSYSQYGILRGVDSYSRGAGIAAAGMVFCPEHLAEISRWGR